MENKNEVAQNLFQEVPGQKKRHASTADASKVPHRKAKRHNAGTPYRVVSSEGYTFRIVVTGRTRWALEELRKAGLRGCTPIDNPAQRWSAYIHELRELGVEIETITEPHEGAFPGWHGRYVLRSGVTQDWKGGAQ
jgi:hypothetical protein